MTKFKLSIIIPSYRTENLEELYKGIQESVFPYTFELVAVGPFFPKSEFLEKQTNFFYYRDFGCPSRAFQKGVSLASGEYICYIPDDCKLENKSLNLCLDFVGDKPKNHGLILRYSEGIGYTGQQDTWAWYWYGINHDDHKLSGISPNWKIAPCFLYNREYFIEIGGLDTSFEHVNCNAHLCAYYTQFLGGELHFSPTKVFSADWREPHIDQPVYQAYIENDAPRFKKFWLSNPDSIKEYNVKFNNWKDSPIYWKRRKWIE